MAGVTLNSLTRTFGDVVAIKDVDLQIKDGEFLVLVGPSGCGKTTCLRNIAGLEEVTSGEIYIGDRLVNNVPPKDRDIAMVFQNYALYPHMSVYDNMAFGLKLRKVPEDEIRESVHDAAGMLGIKNLLDRRPRELSGGQRQRVAVGRAIVRQPAVFLMDEPLSNLDAKLRVQTRAELTKLHRRLGITTVYVTHDQVEAMTMGDRIAVLLDGVVQQVDTPLNLYNHPANVFVAGFIGSPAMNQIEAELVAPNGDIYIDAGSFNLKLPQNRAPAYQPHVGKPVILGIRPDDIYDPAVSGAVDADDGNTIDLTVDVIEPMGAESVIYLTTGTDTIVASLDSSTQAQEQTQMVVGVDMSKVHVFDKKTEKAIATETIRD